MLNITWWPRIVQIEILNIISMEFGLVGYWLKYSSSTPTFILMKNIKDLVHHIQSEPSWIQCTYANWVGDLLESYQTEEAIEESFPAKYYICCCWRQLTLGFVQRCFEEDLEVHRWCTFGFAISWLDLLTRGGRDHWSTQLLWGKGSNFSPELLRISGRLEVQARSSYKWWDYIEGKCSQRLFVFHSWLLSVLFLGVEVFGIRKFLWLTSVLALLPSNPKELVEKPELQAPLEVAIGATDVLVELKDCF